MKPTRTLLLSTTALCACGAIGIAEAADLTYLGPPVTPEMAGTLPAVGMVNYKAALFGGTVSDYGAAGFAGAISIPVSHSTGLQIDGMVGTAGGGTFYGVSANYFWRDPSRGLLGVYASYVGWDLHKTIGVSSPIGGVADVTGADVGKIGVMGEAYFDRISLEGLLAWQFGSDDGVTGKAILAWYPTDDFRIDGGLRYLEGVGAIGVVGLEWAPHGYNGLSLFADAAIGGSDYSHYLGGLKYYFGGDQKSLIRRHREDDPDGDLAADLHTTTGGAYCPPGTTLESGSCDVDN